MILRAKNLTARQFAEEIGIQPSGMSHILSGRNNPSLEFVTKVIRRYPEIDANWLLLGKGEMFSGSSAPAVRSSVLSAEGGSAGEQNAQLDLMIEGGDLGKTADSEEFEDDFLAADEPDRVDVPTGRKVVKMVLIYDDHTFDEFGPSKY